MMFLRLAMNTHSTLPFNLTGSSRDSGTFSASLFIRLLNQRNIFLVLLSKTYLAVFAGTLNFGTAQGHLYSSVLHLGKFAIGEGIEVDIRMLDGTGTVSQKMELA